MAKEVVEAFVVGAIEGAEGAVEALVVVVAVELAALLLAAAVPLVVTGEAAVVEDVDATLLDDLRFEPPTKFRKRWFIDDMNTCARQKMRMGRL